MRALIDTNVILDVLCDRAELSESSSKIFKLSEVGLIEGYISALSIPKIMYILRKELNTEKTKNIIKRLSMIFKISDLKASDIQKAADFDFSDYEDALQSVCADRIKADCIITRNIKDFSNSPIPAVTPQTAIEKIT